MLSIYKGFIKSSVSCSQPDLIKAIRMLHNHTFRLTINQQPQTRSYNITKPSCTDRKLLYYILTTLPYSSLTHMHAYTQAYVIEEGSVSFIQQYMANKESAVLPIAHTSMCVWSRLQKSSVFFLLILTCFICSHNQPSAENIFMFLEAHWGMMQHNEK